MQPPAVAEDPAPASDAPSALKSFAYGIVGMATPDMQAEPQSEYYNTGRMVAAAATVGSLISLLA
jgi:hypothetical protein